VEGEVNKENAAKAFALGGFAQGLGGGVLDSMFMSYPP
jgi:hypothetical protein